MKDIIIIKHPKSSIALVDLERILQSTIGEDSGMSKETVQALIDKIKEQAEEIKNLQDHPFLPSASIKDYENRK